jgi:hypothetical protein
MAGLVCDCKFNTAAMNLYKYNNIYFPDEDFYNCQYFPAHWIEIFVEENRMLDPEDIGTQDKKIQPYTPICTKSELRKMLEGNMKSTKYSNIKGKTYSMGKTALPITSTGYQLHDGGNTND